jgi:acetyl-CoA carboxylase carboxyltransferase component
VERTRHPQGQGGADDVRGSKHLGADITVAQPTAQNTVTSAQGVVNLVHRKEFRLSWNW